MEGKLTGPISVKMAAPKGAGEVVTFKSDRFDYSINGAAIAKGEQVAWVCVSTGQKTVPLAWMRTA